MPDIEATTPKRDKKELRSFLSLLICPALSAYPILKLEDVNFVMAPNRFKGL
jgi:nitrate reductase NapE component